MPSYSHDRVRETRIKLKLDLRYELRDIFAVFPARIATPSVRLLLLYFLPAINRICTEDDGLVNNVMAPYMILHQTTATCNQIAPSLYLYLLALAGI